MNVPVVDPHDVAEEYGLELVNEQSSADCLEQFQDRVPRIEGSAVGQSSEQFEDAWELCVVIYHAQLRVEGSIVIFLLFVKTHKNVYYDEKCAKSWAPLWRTDILVH